ncbi:serine hydrolase [Fusobacterium varium]|uniref:serine hydrolase n=1 Tax=Fusobacterium varium TaxID=856 RepID=UPI0035699A50
MNNKFKEKFENKLLKILKKYDDKKYGIIIKNLGNDFFIKVGNMEQYQAASLIKLTILYELFNNPKYNLDEEMKITSTDKVAGYGIVQYLHENIKFTLRDLAILMIILSDNTATNMLIDICGMDSINFTIKKLGLKNTILQRKMMDSKSKNIGLDNYTSPNDMMKLLEVLNENEEIISIMKKQLCNNKIPYFFEEKIDFAHKTGDLPQIEHDIGILSIGDQKIIIVIMTKNFKNKDEIELNNKVGELIYNFIEEWPNE